MAAATPTSKPQRPLADHKKDISYGIWFSLHHRAALADYDGSWQEYEKLFRLLCKVMGCNCETHCLEMLEKHSIKSFLKMKNKDGKNIGCLYHSSVCHNDVNVRLGKDEMAFSDVEKLFIVKDDFLPCNAPVSSDASSTLQPNIEVVANKFPGLLIKTDSANRDAPSAKRFRFVKLK